MTYINTNILQLEITFVMSKLYNITSNKHISGITFCHLCDLLANIYYIIYLHWANIGWHVLFLGLGVGLFFHIQ